MSQSTQIKLKKYVPLTDGYYLMRYFEHGGLHLVLLTTDLAGLRTMMLDDPKGTIIKLTIPHDDILKEIYFSEHPLSVIIEKDSHDLVFES